MRCGGKLRGGHPVRDLRVGQKGPHRGPGRGWRGRVCSEEARGPQPRAAAVPHLTDREELVAYCAEASSRSLPCAMLTLSPPGAAAVTPQSC